MRGAPLKLKKSMLLCYLIAACWAALLLDQQVVGDDQRLVGIGEGCIVKRQPQQWSTFNHYRIQYTDNSASNTAEKDVYLRTNVYVISRFFFRK